MSLPLQAGMQVKVTQAAWAKIYNNSASSTRRGIVLSRLPEGGLLLIDSMEGRCYFSEDDCELVSEFFPMQNGPAIPWSTAEIIYDAYAKLFGTNQTMTKLAERGGFCWSEIPIIRKDYKRRFGELPKGFV